MMMGELALSQMWLESATEDVGRWTTAFIHKHCQLYAQVYAAAEAQTGALGSGSDGARRPVAGGGGKAKGRWAQRTVFGSD